METLINDIVIGDEYICKCIFDLLPVKLLRIRKIETIDITTFVYTNDPTYTYQIFPYRIVTFYKLNEYKNISNISFKNNYPIKLLKPNTICPISLQEIEDYDEIIMIDQHIFIKDNLEQWFTIKKSNPLTGLLINNTQIKYYIAIIMPSSDIFF
jgi:hypothetical protein